MTRKLGKKVSRKMPTMQVMAQCGCMSLCTNTGSKMEKMLAFMAIG